MFGSFNKKACYALPFAMYSIILLGNSLFALDRNLPNLVSVKNKTDRDSLDRLMGKLNFSRRTVVVLGLDGVLLTPHRYRCVAKSPIPYSLLQKMSRYGKLVVCTQRDQDTEQATTRRELAELGLDDVVCLMRTQFFPAKWERLALFLLAHPSIDKIVVVDNQIENLTNIRKFPPRYELQLFHFSFSPDMLGDFSKHIFPAYEIAPAYLGSSAAGTLIWAPGAGNVPYVLLGHRDDQDTWCNMGGKADDSDKFLHVTAARETAEETMGFYVFPLEVIKRFPSHDLFMPENSMVYRMYFVQGNMIPQTILNEKLSESTGHSKEYAEFRWFPLAGLLGDTLGIPLMEDFAHMLQQEPVIAHMQRICERPPRPSMCWHTFSRFMLDPCNEYAQSSPASDEFEYHDPLESLIDEIIQKRSGELSSKEFPDQMPTDPSTLTLSELSLRERSAVLGSMETDFTGWNDIENYPLSPTLTYLKLILGKKYIEGDGPDSTKKNFRLFIDLVLSKGVELRRSVTPDEEGLDRLANFVKFEKEEYIKGNVVAYHGLDGSLLSLYRYMSDFHSLFTGEHLEPFDALRGSHLLFINPKTKKMYSNILEVYDVLGIGDYDRERNTVLLCVNHMLPLGPGSMSLSTSSSLEYFFNSHSVGAPPIRKLMMEMLILLGMSPQDALECFKEFNSLYEQFYRYVRGKDGVYLPNGALLAISMPVELAKTHTLLVHGGGRPYLEGRHALLPAPDATAEVESSHFPSVMQMIINVREKLKELGAGYEGFFHLTGEEQKKIQLLTSESRILLDPTKKFSVRGAMHFDLSPGAQQLYDNLFRAMLHSHVARLIRSRSPSIQHGIFSLHPERSIQVQFQREYEEQFGKTLQFAPSGSALPFLIEKGLSDVMENYLGAFPGTLQVSSPEIKDAFLKVVLDEQLEFVESFDALLKKHGIDRGVHAILSPKDKQFLGISIITMIDDIPPEEETPLQEEQRIKNMKIFLNLVKDEISPTIAEKFVLELLKPHRPFGLINEFFNFLGLDRKKIFRSIFREILSTQHFDYEAQELIRRLMRSGYTLNPNNDIGRKHFDRLWEARPKNILSRKFRGWLRMIATVIEEYQFHPQHCNLSGDDSILYKMFRTFDEWPHIERTVFCQDASDCAFRNGYISPYCVKDNAKLQSFLFDVTKRHYSDDIIRIFRDNELDLYTVIPEGHLWLQNFTRVLKTGDPEEIMSAVNELDDLCILFMNLGLIGNGIPPASQDAIFLAALKKHAEALCQVKQAILSQEQDKILEFSETAPLSVMKFVLPCFAKNPHALLNVIKRIFQFNPQFFMQHCRMLDKREIPDESYPSDYMTIYCDFSYFVNKINFSERGDFLKEFYSIPAACETLALENDPMSKVFEQVFSANSIEFLPHLFDNRSILEKIIKEKDPGQFIKWMEFIYHNKHEQARDLIKQKLFSETIFDTNVKYADYIIQLIQLFEYEKGLKLLEWYGLQ
jgi:8-oxo-dGTP pyrophosphatase MutT (NUDIX family)